MINATKKKINQLPENVLSIFNTKEILKFKTLSCHLREKTNNI